MYYMIIHLLVPDRINEVVMALTDIDATSVQIIEARRSEELLAFEVPIFAGFQEVFGNRSDTSQVVTCFIEDDEYIEEFIHSLKIANIDFVKDRLGEIFVLPISKSIRLPEEEF